LAAETGERQKRINEILAPLEGKSAQEVVSAIGRGAISAIPYAGGVIAELVGVLGPDFRLKRLRQFVAELAYDLEKLKEKIDAEYVHTEQFVYVFEKTFRGVAENYQKEKLNALRAVLLNSCIKKDIDQELKEYLLDITLQLGTLHVCLIRILRDPQGFYAAEKIRDRRDMEQIPGSIAESLKECLPDVPEGYVRSVWNDLYNMNVISLEPRYLGVGIGGKGSKALEGRLTDLGKQLAFFITTPLNQVRGPVEGERR
jgi:hypothetical protein